MTILDGNSDNDLIRLLNTIQDLSEQLTQSRSISISLHASAGAVKVRLPYCQPRKLRLTDSQAQAAHTQTGFVLRRWDVA
jgi:hypothetical protein